MATKRKSARRKKASRTARARAKRPAARRATRPRARARAEKKYGRRRDLNAPIDSFLKKLSEPQRAIVERIRAVVKGAVPGVQEGLKWGMPVWSKEGLLCYTAPARGYVRFGFYTPGIMDDAAGLPLEGTSRMSHVKLTSASQVVAEAFSNWLRKAAALDGL